MRTTEPLLIFSAAAMMALVGGCALLTPSPISERSPELRLVSTKCSVCHPQPEEGSLSESQFEKVLAAHVRRVRLSVEDEEALRSYLVRDDKRQSLGKPNTEPSRSCRPAPGSAGCER